MFRTTKIAVDVFRGVEIEKLLNLCGILLTDIVAVMKPDDIDGTSRTRRRLSASISTVLSVNNKGRIHCKRMLENKI
jgi:hypothetical protein